MKDPFPYKVPYMTGMKMSGGFDQPSRNDRAMKKLTPQAVRDYQAYCSRCHESGIKACTVQEYVLGY